MLSLGMMIRSINSSRLFAGLAMIMLNIGSKYISLELTPAQEKILRENVGRQMLIFAISWIGSRDIVTALLLTAAFHVLTTYLLNEDSQMCMLPASMKNLNTVIDEDGDNHLSETEIKKAVAILEKARKKEERKVQQNMINAFTASNDLTSFANV